MMEIREALERVYYDPSTYIDSLTPSNGGNNLEQQLLDIYSEVSHSLTAVSEEIENEVSRLQYSVNVANVSLHQELELHSEKLVKVSGAVDVTVDNFHRASESAVRIGERLATSEYERRRIVKAAELMNCIKVFQGLKPTTFDFAKNMNMDELKASLPEQMKSKDWGDICRVSQCDALLFNFYC